MRLTVALLGAVAALGAGPPQHPARPGQHPPCETRQVWVIDGRPTEVWVSEPAAAGSYHPDGSWTWPAQSAAPQPAAFAPQPAYSFGASGGCAGGACGVTQSYAPARRGVFRR